MSPTRTAPPSTEWRSRRPPPRAARRRPKPSVFRAGKPRRRLVALLLLSAVLVAVVVARVGMLQTVDQHSLASYGERQRLRSVVIPAARGTIFDREGQVLALSVPATTIWADPRAITDPRTPDLLAQALALKPADTEALRQKLMQPGKAPADKTEFEYVSRQVDQATADKVTALKLDGIYEYAESKRYYPSGELAESLLGSTDLDGKGTAGLELQYNKVLTGTPGELVRERDQSGRTIPTGRREVIPAEPGDDLRLTIDRNLQYESEQSLLEEVARTHSKGGMVIVMDTATGDLVSVANVRVDDTTGQPEISKANLAAVDTYEPGSVNKVITASAALQEGVATRQTMFDIPASYQYDDHVFVDAEPHGDVTWSLQDIVVHSSNIGSIKLAQALGSARLDMYLRAFGLGSVTDLNFPGETKGLLPPYQQWKGTQNATIAYGQGVGVTALQMVAAVNTIANHGTYVAPRLVESTFDAAGHEHPEPPSPTHQVISANTASAMNTVLEQVVCSGTATRAAVPGYTVAGKTGTAYKAQANGTYVDASGKKHYYASFVGYAPAEAPRFTVLVSMDEPQGDHYGGLVAAPLFVQVAQAALRQFQVPPPPGGGCPAKR